MRNNHILSSLSDRLKLDECPLKHLFFFINLDSVRFYPMISNRLVQIMCELQRMKYSQWEMWDLFLRDYWVSGLSLGWFRYCIDDALLAYVVVNDGEYMLNYFDDWIDWHDSCVVIWVSLALRDIVLHVLLPFGFIVSFSSRFRSFCLAISHRGCGIFQYACSVAPFVYYLRLSCVDWVARRSSPTVINDDVPAVTSWIGVAFSFYWQTILPTSNLYYTHCTAEDDT
jgi:hypothetical protein